MMRKIIEFEQRPKIFGLRSFGYWRVILDHFVAPTNKLKSHQKLFMQSQSQCCETFEIVKKMLSEFPPNGLFLVEKAKSARRLCLAAAVGRIVCRHSRTERRKNRGKTSEKYKFHSKRAQCTRKRSTSQSCTHAYVCAMRLSVARCARNGWRLSTSRDRSSV